MLYRPFLAACLLALAACSTSAPPVETFNDKAALGERSVLLVQTTATSLLRAGKITADQDELIQSKLRLINRGIKLAKDVEAKDPLKAANDLAAELAQLKVLQTQTGVAQ